MKSSHLFFALAVPVILAGALCHLEAQWAIDPSINTPTSTAVNDQSSPTSVTDGAGGVIITWQDFRNGTDNDIYAQHISSTGVVQWTPNGVAACVEPYDQSSPVIASDGAGGAFIAWNDFRSNSNYHIYAQHINSAGVIQWGVGGVPIVTAANGQASPTITSDGTGGAIITWEDYRSGTSNDIYAQRINSAGVVQWTINGVPICTAVGDQLTPTITSDGGGGAIITWYDYRNGLDYDIYAQRVNSAGVVQWTVNGVPISTATNNQIQPVITSDSTGGAIITWMDFRSGTDFDIYAQRVNAAGVVQWTANGLPIVTAPTHQGYQTITSDGAGGAIIAWQDERGPNYNIYAQRVDGAGAVHWTANGLPITTGAVGRYIPTITSDAGGGAIIAWEDGRNGSDIDIYAQRVNAAGAAEWTANGVPISTAPNDQALPVITSSGTGGAIVVWEDQRSGTMDIYAQYVDPIGTTGYRNPILAKIKDVPGDQGGKVTIAWKASQADVFPYQIITDYTIWRGVDLGTIPKNVFGSKNTLSVSTNMKYRKEVNGTTTTYWEYIGVVPSSYFTNYSYTAATLSDSTSSGNPYYKFEVIGQTYDQYTFWASNPDSGYSVDNLPPHATSTVAAQTVSSTQVNVHWAKDIVDPDVGYYQVYRSTMSNFNPAPANSIGITTDTLVSDTTPVQGVANYYRVVTVDIHGNRSDPSAQAVAGSQTTQQYSLKDGWNMVSVPLVVSNFGLSALYPTAISQAFLYSGSYIVTSTLANGTGYWIRFNGNQQTPISGYLFQIDSIPVQPGWNMVGSVSTPVQVTNIQSNPPALITSRFFGYQGSYIVATTIQPGQAYWVKVSSSGSLILNGSAATSTSTIRIVATEELPPSPPGEISEGVAVGVPNQFELDQNYPNPFNPSTSLNYSIPVESQVLITVSNMLGQVVEILVDGVESAGYKNVNWNASSFASGIYFYRLDATSVANPSKTFTQMKKMVLMK